MRRFLLTFILFISFMIILVSCSLTKYVPDGKYLLDEVIVEHKDRELKNNDMSSYLRQHPNAKWFNLFKTQLYIYNWSGKDSIKRWNKFLRRLGTPPVIYDSLEASRTVGEMERALQNQGYMRAKVILKNRIKKKKLKEYYYIIAGQPYLIRNLSFDIPEYELLHYVDTVHTLLKRGDNFNVSALDNERMRITKNLRKGGYYYFHKDDIHYTADTVRNGKYVDITLHIPVDDDSRTHSQYKIGNIIYLTNFNLVQHGLANADSILYKGYPIYYQDRLFLRPSVLINNLAIKKNALFDEGSLERTYANLGRLQALKYSNISFRESRNSDKTLDAYIQIARNKNKSVSLELEGTNSSGDLGAGVSVAFQHRNLFKGSEAFLFKVHADYEAISGLTGNYRSSNYQELGAEANIKFPNFLFPFVSNNFGDNIKANTEFGIQYNYQLRPEFKRIVSSAKWSYTWGFNKHKFKHRLDLVDINYLYMPWISSEFYERYVAGSNNYISKYNYSDRFILKSGYTLVYNSAGQHLMNNVALNNAYTVRLSVESAGNLLYLMAKAIHKSKNDKGEYTLLNIPFAQYLKGDLDITKNILIDPKNSISLHLGTGVAYPYGNGSIVPFEKRYFSGGANSVRGWTVRNLGPGIFPGDGNVFNRSGDIKLDMNVEYRTYLFWKLRGALFIDAGNVWTIRKYKDQPGGEFDLGKFYKQIAVGYGAGIRLDLDFFLIRLDMGMKAVNPIYKSKRDFLPLIHPNFKRDFAFHLAIGYPF